MQIKENICKKCWSCEHVNDTDSDCSEVFVNVVSQKTCQNIKCDMIVADRPVTFLIR